MIKKRLRKLITVIFAMSGILLDKINPLRIMVLFLIAAVFTGRFLIADKINFIIALIIFLTIFCTRYVFLFFSFTRKGIAYHLKQNFGEQQGYEIYQSTTAILFFLSATGFTLLVNKSIGILFPSFLKNPLLLSFVGIPIIIIGLVTNIWSALIIGIDVYYYKDLFLGRKIGEFRKEGPYNFLSNPMYSIGQASGYGTAILSASVPGIAFIFLNQVLMYIFYLMFEKPHIKKILLSA